jgi:hypothetical protein
MVTDMVFAYGLMMLVSLLMMVVVYYRIRHADAGRYSLAPSRKTRR